VSLGLQLQELKEKLAAWTRRDFTTRPEPAEKVLIAINLVQSFLFVLDCEANPVARELPAYKAAAAEVFGDS